MTLEIKIETITPEWAAKILASNNVVNRKLRTKTVTMIAKDIENGDYNGLNGETIKFGEDGNLKDGQHRLQAIVEADKSVEMIVAYNVPNESQITIDAGTKRNYADVLHMRGETETTQLAAIVRQVALKEAKLHFGEGRLISNLQMDRTLEKYPELRTITREVQKIYVTGGRLVPQSILGLCVWMFSKIDEEDASFFVSRLHDGQNLQIGDPVYTLRKKLIQIREFEGHSPSQRLILGMVIIAWNAFRDGKKIHQIRFKSGGSNPDPLPEPH